MDIAPALLKLLDIANPLAGAAAEFIAGKLGLSDKSIDAVQQTISGMSGTDQVKLKQIAADLQDHLASYGVSVQIAEINAAAGDVASVNATLQADARGDSWIQKNHHAIESLLTVCCVIAVYFVLPLCKIPVPAIPESAFIMLAAILGVTSWQHGKTNQILADK